MGIPLCISAIFTRVNTFCLHGRGSPFKGDLLIKEKFASCYCRFFSLRVDVIEKDGQNLTRLSDCVLIHLDGLTRRQMLHDTMGVHDDTCRMTHAHMCHATCVALYTHRMCEATCKPTFRMIKYDCLLPSLKFDDRTLFYGFPTTKEKTYTFNDVL